MLTTAHSACYEAIRQPMLTRAPAILVVADRC